MTDGNNRFDDIWASLIARADDVDDLRHMLDQIEKLEKELASVEDEKPVAIKLPYAGAEPISDSPWD